MAAPPTGISEEEMYELIEGLLPLLKQLKEALGETAAPTPRPTLTTVAGQGRGSRKPPAKLRSVEIIPESRKA